MTYDSTPTSLFVRPYGYVADRAVARRLGDRNLFLGNALAATPETCDRMFDSVLSLTREPRALTTHHRPLTDDDTNDWRTLADAVDTARRLYRRDGSVLIHCKAGVSRSSAVTAAALAVEKGRQFVDALHLLQDARPHAVPRPALHEQGIVYVAARS
jgi:atypical dual specificity phosphatase